MITQCKIIEGKEYNLNDGENWMMKTKNNRIVRVRSKRILELLNSEFGDKNNENIINGDEINENIIIGDESSDEYDNKKSEHNVEIQNSEIGDKNNENIINGDTINENIIIGDTSSDEYDNKKVKLRSRGLGDTISKLTSMLGIEECEGCKKRKERLNNLYPWMRRTRELTPEENDLIIDLAERQVKIIEPSESIKLFKIYNEITNQRVERCACPGLHKVIIERMYELTY